MKSVLLSIKSEHCNRIISGHKSLEIRNTAPNTETPFKCYIYCTKNYSRDGYDLELLDNEKIHKLNGKGKVTREQSAWLALLSSAGYMAVMCRGFEEAVKTIECYIKQGKERK